MWVEGYSKPASQTLSMNLVGGEDTRFSFTNQNETAAKTFYYDGDLSGFYGMLDTVTSNTLIQLSGSATNFPGTLKGANGSQLKLIVAAGTTNSVGTIDTTDMTVVLDFPVSTSVIAPCRNVWYNFALKKKVGVNVFQIRRWKMANETLILAVSLLAASSCTAGARMSATGDSRLPDKAVVSAESAKIELGVPFTDGVVLQRGREVPVWGKAAPGAKVKVSFAGMERVTTAGADCSWRVALGAMEASCEGRTLVVESGGSKVEVKDVLVGEVWFCSGQSNAGVPLWGNSPRYRDAKGALRAQITDRPLVRFCVSPFPSVAKVVSAEPRKGFATPMKWKKFTPENLKPNYAFSAMGVYFALEIHNATGIPVGIMGAYCGSTRIEAWTPKSGFESVASCRHFAEQRLEDSPDCAEAKADKLFLQNQPGILWNGLVAPWTPFAMRGVIWYQGCHNARASSGYADKMQALYNGWSKEFENPGLKLYFVQLPQFSGYSRIFNIQEEQARFAAAENNAGMVVINDVSNFYDIHPSDKETIGQRLALLALKRDYGFAGIKADSPTLSRWRIDGDKFVLSFDNAEGWFLYHDDVKCKTSGFEIAGADGRFVPAVLENLADNGTIKGADLMVRADGVTAPKSLRYLHSRPGYGALHNEVGLPLGAFHIYESDSFSPVDERAFSSVEEARDAARHMPKPAVVRLAAGVHRLEKPLHLGPADSGVTYVADGKVVISGARQVDGWRVEADGTWSAPVPWVKADRSGGFRSMRVNGTMRPRARLPKKGYFTVVNDDLPAGTRYNVPRPCFFYDPKEFNAEWANLGDAEIVCYHFWTDTHLRIASVDTVSNKVTFVSPSRKAFDTGFSNNKSGGMRGIYVVENIPAAMTEPGEWWIEYGAARVHYRPMLGERPDEVNAEVPFSPALVVIEGTPEKDGRLAEDIVFCGINFELSQYELSPDEVNDEQGAADVSAAVCLSWARRCRFEDCVFEDLGGYAVDMLKGCRDNAVVKCKMRCLGAGGVRLDGGAAQSSPAELNSGCSVADCDIGPYGIDFPSAVGVLLKNAECARICHNDVHDGHYTGISAGWVWGYYSSVSWRNEISHNHVHHIGMEGLLSDMGGIYTLGPSYGTRVANNRVHDIASRAYGGWGIYNDEGTAGMIVENNVVYDTQHASFFIHYGKDIVVRNNIFAFSKANPIHRSLREQHVTCEVLNNIVYFTSDSPYRGNWKDADEPFPVHRRANKKVDNKASALTFFADRNVYFNPELPLEKVKFGSGQDVETWRKAGKDEHSLYADPLFRDAAGRDFRLSPDSPAFRLGFVDFDQGDVGPR